jgi:hypothetical protein
MVPAGFVLVKAELHKSTFTKKLSNTDGKLAQEILSINDNGIIVPGSKRLIDSTTISKFRGPIQRFLRVLEKVGFRLGDVYWLCDKNLIEKYNVRELAENLSQEFEHNKKFVLDNYDALIEEFMEYCKNHPKMTQHLKDFAGSLKKQCFSKDYLQGQLKFNVEFDCDFRDVTRMSTLERVAVEAKEWSDSIAENPLRAITDNKGRERLSIIRERVSTVSLIDKRAEYVEVLIDQFTHNIKLKNAKARTPHWSPQTKSQLIGLLAMLQDSSTLLDSAEQYAKENPLELGLFSKPIDNEGHSSKPKGIDALSILDKF